MPVNLQRETRFSVYNARTSGAAQGMLIWTLLLLLLDVNVVARPVVAECCIHLAVPKSAICQIAKMPIVPKDADIKV